MASHLEQLFAGAWVVQCPDLPFEQELPLPAYQAWAQEKKDLGLSKRAVAMKVDFAWPEARVALEIQGGTWVQSGHSSGTGITRDACKSFLAQADGWVLAAFTDSMLKKQSDIWLPKLEAVIRSRLALNTIKNHAF